MLGRVFAVSTPHSSSLSRVSVFSRFTPPLRFPMSAGRNINDVLMGAARAKSGGHPPLKHISKNKGNKSPSPKKNKKSDAEIIKSEAEIVKNGEEIKKKDAEIVKIGEEIKKNDAEISKNDGVVQAEESSCSNKKEKPETVMIRMANKKVPLLSQRAADFDPLVAAFWRNGERVPFLFLARALQLVSEESGRIAITEIMCNAYRTVIATTPEDLLPFVYLSANRIAPAHHGVELGIGDAALVRSLADSYGSTPENIRKQLKALGDLGLVAKSGRSKQRQLLSSPILTCVKVLETFRFIAKESGKDSQEKKRNQIKNLLSAAIDCEPLYLVRLLQEKMRIGLAEQTVLVALAHAAVYAEQPPVPSSQLQNRLEEAAKIVKQVYSVLPIYDKIVSVLISDGVCKLHEVCKFTIGIPVGPMLAKPTKGVSEILDKFQDIKFTCEYKYDGERAQIHFMECGTVEIYSRNAERNTGKFPDIVEFIGRCKRPSVTSFVLDCEVVAFDREKQKILPFQILTTRARKGVISSDIKVQVCVFAFDLLYLNGQQLLQDQLKARRELLYSSFEEIPGRFQFATALESNDLEEIQKFLTESVNFSCEGLIIKTLEKDATYEPAKRSNNWLKLKKDYMDSIGDSLDLVPIGAFHGRGKRTGVYGAFLLACYDEMNEEYQSVCKIGTGFSESMLEERSASLRSKVIPKPKRYYKYGETLGIDVWFEPSEVWEVKAADLSISPVHIAAAGIVDSNKGISLRFPRLLRVREDKNPDQATSSEQIAEMFRAQKINHAGTNDNEDDDY